MLAPAFPLFQQVVPVRILLALQLSATKQFGDRRYADASEPLGQRRYLFCCQATDQIDVRNTSLACASGLYTAALAFGTTLRSRLLPNIAERDIMSN